MALLHHIPDNSNHHQHHHRPASHSLLLMQLQSALPQPSSSAYSPTCDDAIADEADEPPDELVYRYPSLASLSDGECLFNKHTISFRGPPESLLTRALTSPDLAPIDRDRTRGFTLKRGLSIVSTCSTSTADLTSDAGLTSRTNSPSPPAPMFLGPRLLSNMMKEPAPAVEIVGEVPKKRCITFACGGKDAPRRPPPAKIDAPAAPPKKPCALKFACTQRPHSPPPTTAPLPRRDSDVTVTDVRPLTAPCLKTPSIQERVLYDSESAVEWNLPTEKGRLLKVDDVLQKERDIRKLSEEAEQEDEADLEEAEGVEDEDEEDEDDGDEEEEEEDEDEDEDEDDDEFDEEDDLSGNETDNEAGFASSDDDDIDDIFFGYKPIQAPSPTNAHPIRPLCCRTASDTSIDSLNQPSPTRTQTSPRRIPRAPTPELPDSTDFVCGTLDEDRPTEEAYISCLEERRKRKAEKAGRTPWEIDPSFPESGIESGDEDRVREKKRKPRRMLITASPAPANRGRSPRPTKATSPPAPVRWHSPPPKRRIHSPPPQKRNHSPPPAKRNNSPSPRIRGRKLTFSTTAIVRTKSLPRASSGLLKCCPLPTPKSRSRPVQITRTAADIVKGLEKKKERRRARLVRERERKGVPEEVRGACRGEGVEKMRELGLGLEKRNGQVVKWVLSA